MMVETIPLFVKGVLLGSVLGWLTALAAGGVVVFYYAYQKRKACAFRRKALVDSIELDRKALATHLDIMSKANEEVRGESP